MMDLEEFKEMYQESRMTPEKMEYLKIELSDLAQSLKKLDLEKMELEFRLKEINQKKLNIEDKIRSVWLPHIAGAEKASIDLGNISLQTEPKLSVSIEERDQAIQWLMDNGYQGAMKWDLHTQTLYKIAREHYEKAESIPGLNYKHYQLIKIK